MVSLIKNIKILCIVAQFIVPISMDSIQWTGRAGFNARIDFEGMSFPPDQANSTILNRFVDPTACLSPLRFENYSRINRLLMTDRDCVRIYREEDCTGPFVTLRSRYIYYAFRWNSVNDKARSLGPCDEECSPEHIQSIPTNVLLNLQDTKVAEGVHGFNVTINVTGCIIIPRIFNRTLSKHIKVSDLDRLDDHICVQVHEHPNCTGLSVSYRPTLPWAGPLSRQTRQVWRTYRSVSVCSYNCIRQWNHDRKSISKVSPVPGIVTVFDEPNFNGNFIEVNLTRGCANLTDEWEGESLAIKTNNQCIIVYSQFGCSGSEKWKSYRILSPLNTNIHSHLKEFKIRSLKLCYSLDGVGGFDGSMASQFDGKNGVRIFFEGSLRTQYLDGSRCVSGFGSELGTIYWTEPLDPRGCLNLYRYEDCQGEHITKRFNDPTTEYYWRDETLTLIKYRSMGPCNDYCSSSLNPLNLNSKMTVPLEVFLYTNYSKEAKRDRSLVMINDENHCALIPRIKERQVEFYEVRGEEGFDHCIELHKNWDCTGGSTKGRDQESDVDRTDNLWKFVTASAISHCGYRNCKNPVIEGRNAENDEEEIFPHEHLWNIVTLFDESNFNGNHKDLNLSQGCINITDEWNGKSKSIRIYDQCIHIYSQFGCSNSVENLLLHEGNRGFLADFSFNWGVKSIRLCQKHFAVHSRSDGRLQIAMFAIVGALVLSLLMTSVAIIYLKRRFNRFLTKEEIHEFENGIGNLENMINGEISVEHLPYDQDYEISKENIVIDMGSPLGTGAYAIVYKGRIKNQHGSEEDRKIAVKTIKPYSNLEFTRALLLEIKTMIFVGKHGRIIELIGCCTQNLRNGELYVMTELCQNGSMEAFLRQHQTAFVSFVDDKGEICIPNPTDEQGYVNSRMEPITPSYFNTFHCLQWALQIAEGMEYLAFKKVIHGDLATRNVLLDLDFNVKISDFGLSRQLHQYSQYVKRTHAPLPWRWLAIESLHSYSFSSESDVWSYGVSLWEIFTSGHIPYPDRNWDSTFLTDLSNGLRLSKPCNAPTDVFALMVKCWIEDPSGRITFSNLKIIISKILDRYSDFTGCASYNKDYMYLQLTEED